LFELCLTELVKKALPTLLMHKGNKSYLDTKICESCGLPFSWRKKWKMNWDEVKYCSEKCRRKKSKKQ
jgi:hypothetical protein